MYNIQIVNDALSYIEKNIKSKILVDNIAKHLYLSRSSLLRQFYSLVGIPISEYIHKRQMSISAKLLIDNACDVITLSETFGYASLQSFTRAFSKCFGCTPSKFKENNILLSYYLPIKLTVKMEGGMDLKYKIVTTNELKLTGIKRTFQGKIQDRFIQEKEFFDDTRNEQDFLYAHSVDKDMRKIYCVIKNQGEDLFDFYIAYNCGDLDFLGYEKIILPQQKYVVFSTSQCKYPTRELEALNQTIYNSALNNLGYSQNKEKLALEITYWFMPNSENREKRYVEIFVPIF